MISTALRATQLLLAAATLQGQSEPAQHISLSRYYFATPEAEKADRRRLSSMLQELQALRGSLASSGKTLLRALQLNDEIERAYNRHDAYLLLRSKMDRRDRVSRAGDESLIAEVESKTAFLKQAISKIPAKRLNAFVASTPQLRIYLNAIDQFRRGQSHSIETSREEVLKDFAPQISGWQYDLYDDLLSRVDYGVVSTPRGNLDVASQGAVIASDPDPEIRKQGFVKAHKGLSKDRDLFAFALARLAEAGNKSARLHGFPNAADAHYFAMGFEPQQVRAMLSRVQNLGEFAKRFERLRAKEVAAGLGIAQAKAWDLQAFSLKLPLTTFADARGVYHKAFGKLGAWYQAEFDDLISPQSGRLDVGFGATPNRAEGGFSVGFPGTTSALYVGSYRGSFKDMSVVAHEGGHAVHRQMMNRNGVLPVYASGPSFLSESFAELNELILADYLAQTAPTAELRRYYEERFLGIKGLDFLFGAKDAQVEQAIYDHLAGGGAATADDFDQLTLEVTKKYSIWPSMHVELADAWITSSLIYEDPFYDVNYVYASLLALNYFKLYKERPDWFSEHYRNLLQGGLSATPANLLKGHLGIDLDDSIVKAASAVIEARLRHLES